MLYPLPGTSRFSQGTMLKGTMLKGTMLEGMISSRPTYSEKTIVTTHFPTDYAVDKQAEIERYNAQLSEKISREGTRESHQLSEGATCIDPLTGYDIHCTHAPSNVCSLN